MRRRKRALEDNVKHSAPAICNFDSVVDLLFSNKLTYVLQKHFREQKSTHGEHFSVKDLVRLDAWMKVFIGNLPRKTCICGRIRYQETTAFLDDHRDLF